jgi:hypothetical protein
MHHAPQLEATRYALFFVKVIMRKIIGSGCKSHNQQVHASSSELDEFLFMERSRAEVDDMFARLRRCGVITVDEDCIAHGFGCSLFLGRTILGIIGKMVYCVTLSAVYVLSLELFPLWATGKGLGISSLSARIGTLTSPFIVLLSATQASLPL